LSLHVNTLANVVGRVWNAALGVFLIPIYVKLLGVESYALVGIHATLQTIFGLLDLGLGAGLNRELARLTATGADDHQRRDLLATFDLIGLAAAAIIALSLFAMAPIIAFRWVNAQDLDRHVIVDAIRMMGVIIGLQVPIGFYHGGLNGLQRQVLYNVVSVSMNTIRGVGAALLLASVAATVRVFFGWQICITVAAAAVSAILTHRLVDGSAGRGRAAREYFTRVWRYSSGWLANSVGVNLLGQADKLILSRMLSLRDFGYYTFASYGALLLWNLVAAVSSAFFPRFNGLIARGDETGLAAEYRRGNQTLAAVLIPVSFVILFFPREILLLWTRDAALTAATASLLAIFAAGMTAVGMANIAYTIALCEGMFRTTMKVTAVLAAIWVPAMWLATREYGAVGAATVWALMNASWIAIVPLLQRRHLPGEGWTWLRQALFLPGTMAALLCGGARLVAPPLENPLVTAGFLGGIWIVTVTAIVLTEPALRSSAATLLRRFGPGEAR
jgi:O-antigen/teichoic acid export membrane protein